MSKILQQGKSQFAINLASNVAFFAISVVTSIWFIPYLIHHLGVATYGLIPLATTVTSYMTIITFALNIAVGRYMTIALEKSNDQEANRIFNTAFWGSAIIAGILLVPGIFLIVYANHFFQIPVGLEAEVRWLFAFAVAAFLITTIGSAFEMTSYCRNRFDLRNLVHIANLLTRIGSVVVFFHFSTANLFYVGLGIFLASLINLMGAILVSKRLLPFLAVRWEDFNLQVLKEMSGTGIWIFISQIGTLLILSIDLVVANRLLGAESTGQYASVMQWSALLRNFAMVIAGVFGPTIVAYYAQRNFEELVRYARKSVKFVGLTIALPVGLICGFSKPLLYVWLGPDFVSLALLLVIMTFHLCLNLGYLPLHQISMATNSVKWPAIMQIIVGILNLGLAIFLAKIWGLYGIALAGGM
ncbi:MAG: oligosaccharide flippase family protein, partial [Candidatus Omnitrophica bacterium]|nr:oligosaccharide flippase family protein [Candidatus Omnitrophota bacterium]